MASGPTITLSGGASMTQLLTGDIITHTDFNGMRENVNRLLGTAQDVNLGTLVLANTYGYTQGGAGTAAAAAQQLVLAEGIAGAFKDLQDDIQALCAFLGQSIRGNVGTDVTTNDIITAVDWSNAMLNIEDCWNTRFVPASVTNSTDNTVTSGISWDVKRTQVTTWTFANENDCRGFFNGGGALGVSATRSGGTASAQNTFWSDRLSALSDVWLQYDTTTASAGTLTNIGFYELTTTNQALVTYFGSGGGYYGSDYVVVSGRVNSISNPTQVIITIELFNDSGITTDGTLTINARRRQPNSNGSGFMFAVASASQAAITNGT